MSANSPFMWHANPRPSIFASDKKFIGYASKTASQVATENADAYEARYGRSLGFVGGISLAADKGAEERAFMRKRTV